MFAFYELTLHQRHQGNINNHYLVILLLEYLFPGCSQSNVWGVRDSFPELQDYINEYQDEIIDYYISNQIGHGGFHVDITINNPQFVTIIFLKG